MHRLAALMPILLLAMAVPCMGVEPRPDDPNITWLAVGPDGSDDDPGTRQEPFATLERARDAVRELRRTGSLGEGDAIVVKVLPGTYYRDKPFELTEEDSGTENTPVIYTGPRDGGVTLSGGSPVTGFGLVTDETVLSTLRPEAPAPARTAGRHLAPR